MKDAKGHGSNAKGAHTEAVRALPDGTIPIAKLKLSTDGLATAKGSFFWGMKPEQVSKGPIAVSIAPSGERYLLDGYHRVVAAQKTGRTELPVKYVAWTPGIARRYKQDDFK